MTDSLHSDLASLQRHDDDAPRAPSALRRLAVPFVLVVAAGTAGWYGYGRFQAAVFKQEVRTTEIAMLSPSQADVQVTATGYVIPQLTSKLGTRIPGRLAKVNVIEGDTVKQGDVIARLDDSDQRLLVVAASKRIDASQARIATAKANLAEISQQVRREKQLVASGTVGSANLENLVAREQALTEQVRQAEAEVVVAQADLGPAGINLKDSIITAPINGRIVNKPATVGEVIGIPGAREDIVEIVDFDSLMVEADVPEARLHLVKMGGPCEVIFDAYPNQRFRCHSVSLGQKVNRSKGTVVVKVRFDKGEDLSGVLPEMSARVSFLSKEISEASRNEKPKKVVTQSAVVDRAGNKVVFTVKEGKIHEVPVKVGEGNVGGAVELLDGPPQGTKVVAKPTAETADGQNIKETDK